MLTVLREKKIETAQLYCVTSHLRAGQSYEAMVESACKGGADVVQLREKNYSTRELISLAKRLRSICSRYETIFIVNDRIDVALACQANGVHLGQDDLPLVHARKIMNGFQLQDRFLVGCSTHSLEQALKAQEEGADYIGCGPIFSTPTKPDYKAVGLELVRQYREKIKIPFVAIGGINQTNLLDVIEAGAKSVAVVRSVFGSDQIEESVRSLKSLMGVEG